MDLTDEQWALLEPLLPEQQRRRHNRRAWKTLAPCPRGTKRGVVGAQDGSSLARGSQALPAIPNLPQALPRVGA